MSDTSEMRPPRARSKPFEIYVATSAIAFLVSYVATYVYSFYLQKMTFDSQFHPGADFPGSLVDPAVHDPNRYNVGVHFFGDFWTTLLRSGQASPYLNIESLGSSSYPPFAHILFRPLAYLPYPIGLCLFLFCSTLMVFGPFWIALRNESVAYRLLAIVVGTMLTYPFLFAMDRGNNIAIVAGALLFALISYRKGDLRLAAVMIGIAAAVKIYPLFFVLIFMRRHQWKFACISALTACGLTFASLFLMGGGWSANITQLRLNLEALSGSPIQIHLNHSLASLFASLSQTDSLFNIGLVSSLQQNFEIVFLAGVVISVVSIGVSTVYLDGISQMRSTLILITAAQTLFMQLTYGYTLILYLTAVIWLLLEGEKSISSRLDGFLLGVLMASKGIPLGLSPTQLLNYLNPLIQSALFLIAVCSLWWNTIAALRLKRSGPSEPLLQVR